MKEPTVCPHRGHSSILKRRKSLQGRQRLELNLEKKIRERGKFVAGTPTGPLVLYNSQLEVFSDDTWPGNLGAYRANRYIKEGNGEFLSHLIIRAHDFSSISVVFFQETLDI